MYVSKDVRDPKCVALAHLFIHVEAKSGGEIDDWEEY